MIDKKLKHCLLNLQMWWKFQVKFLWLNCGRGRWLFLMHCCAIHSAFFRSATTQTVNTIHKPLLDMMSKSHGLSRALGTSGVFVSSILKRLHTSEAIVLRSLLKMLQFIHQHHFYPRQLVLDHNMYCIVRAFALEEGQVLVNQMANRLLRDFQTSTLS